MHSTLTNFSLRRSLRKKVSTGGAKHLDKNQGNSHVNCTPDASPLQRMHNVGKFFFKDYLNPNLIQGHLTMVGPLFPGPSLDAKSTDYHRGRRHKVLDRGKPFEYPPVAGNPGQSAT